MFSLGLRTIKTAIGAAIALMIAQSLHLDYANSAAIITILCIQSTKRDSVRIAFKRFMAVLVAITIGYVLFQLLGFHPVVFGLLILLLIPVLVRFTISEGLTTSTVVMLHILSEKEITRALIINELTMVTIGITVALLLNLYVPSMEDDIKKLQKEIEKYMRDILLSMAHSLREQSVPIHEQETFLQLKTILDQSKKKANMYLKNHLFSDEVYYLRYMEMRSKQYEVLVRMRQHFRKFSMTYEQTIIISELTEFIASNLKEDIDPSISLNEIKRLRETLAESELPKTREEFLNRAMLHQFTNELEYFLEIKKDFYTNYFENQ